MEGWKPTHIDQYLQWDSHHPISSRYSVVGILYHRARTICSNNKLLQQEDDHLSKALRNCNYPIWALNRVKIKMNNPAHKKKNKTSTTQHNNTPRLYITVPYYRGLSESVKTKMQQLGGSSILQRRYHHQKPPGGPKGQGSYDEEEWGHLQLQIWQGGV